MSYEAFLDGLNKGGFAFLGMVGVGAMLFGGWRLANWLFKIGWPDLMAALSKSGSEFKEGVQIQAAIARESMAQTQQVVSLQSTMVDNIMDSHKTIAGKLDTVVTKLDGISDKIGGQQ